MLSKYKWYRKYKKGLWYKHQNTFQLSCLFFDYFWSKYGEINRYTEVVEIEHWADGTKIKLKQAK